MDYTQDAATLLRLGTTEAHERAEQSPGAKLLTNGMLSKENYVRFLVMLWHVYSVLEDALDTHSSDPIISPTYNPRLLFRTSALSADIAYFLQIPETEWKRHPLISSFYQELPREVNEYITSIRAAASSDLSRLLAHAYVRYLGDLSGGQVIKRRVRKAFGLAEDECSGTQFYDFEKLEGRGQASIGDMRTIKVWYRDGLNKGVGDDLNKKAAIIEEANLAFRLNEGIFNLLQETEKTPPSPKKIQHVHESYLSLANVVFMALLIGILHFIFQSSGLVNHGANHFYKWTRVQKWISDLLS